MRAVGDVLIPRDSPRLAPALILLEFMEAYSATLDPHTGPAMHVRSIVRRWRIANKLFDRRCNEAELAQELAEEDGDEVTDEDVRPTRY